MTAMNQPVRRRVVTERRRRPLMIGIWLAGAGLAVTIIAGLLLAGNQAVQVLAAEDRATVPDPLTFEAQDSSYAVLLLPTTIGIPFMGNPVAALTCDVDLADGTTAVLRGARQATSIETGAGETVGSFDAVPGPTTVTCDFTGSPDTSGYFVAVAAQRSVPDLVAFGGVALGIVAMIVGAILIGKGIRGRAVIRPMPGVRS